MKCRSVACVWSESTPVFIHSAGLIIHSNLDFKHLISDWLNQITCFDSNLPLEHEDKTAKMVPVVYHKLRLWSKMTFISTSGPKGLKRSWEEDEKMEYLAEIDLPMMAALAKMSRLVHVRVVGITKLRVHAFASRTGENLVWLFQSSDSL
ncbi:hypothetical protein LXL04_008447 [Taraxacum kok-saghyz]